MAKARFRGFLWTTSIAVTLSLLGAAAVFAADGTAVGEAGAGADSTSGLVRGVLIGVFAGLVTSALWSVALLAYIFVKDRAIQWSFRRSVQARRAVASTVGWVAVAVENSTRWPVIVRSVWVIGTDGDRLELEYTGQLAPIYLSHIMLKSQVWDWWEYPLEDAPPGVTDGGVIVEYATPLGGSRVLTVRLHPEHLALLKRTWSRGLEMLEEAGPPIIVPTLDPY